MKSPFWLSRGEWLSADALQRLQSRKLAALVKHAYRHVPFYRRLFDDAGVRPEEIRSPADLVRLPYVTRQDIASRPVEEITADNVNLARCVKARTSGSLGVPLTVYARSKDRLLHDLIWARARIANGQRLFDRTVTVREPGREHPLRWFQRFGIWRKTFMSCLDDADTSRLERLIQLRPDVLAAYPSGLKLLIRMMERDGRRVHPRCVFTMSELLTDADRREIEDAFGVSVRDFYGTHEAGLIAWQCPEQSQYHVNADSVILEWEWDGKPVPPGRRARMVCTVLHSFAMPFIRYVLGDVGIACETPCLCGRGLPLMKMVEGREADFVVLSDGRWISPDAFSGLIGALPGVRQFQVIQNEDLSVVVQLQADTETGTAVAAELTRLLGPQISVHVTCSEAPVRSGSGKQRPVISHAAERRGEG